MTRAMVSMYWLTVNTFAAASRGRTLRAGETARAAGARAGQWGSIASPPTLRIRGLLIPGVATAPPTDPRDSRGRGSRCAYDAERTGGDGGTEAVRVDDVQPAAGSAAPRGPRGLGTGTDTPLSPD